MFESDSELLMALHATSNAVNKVLLSGKSIVKVLDKLDSLKTLQRQDWMADALAVLKTEDLSAFGCSATQKDLIQTLESRVQKMRFHAHQMLLSGLHDGLEKPEQMRVLSDNPLIIYVHPLTLEVNIEQAKATWTYAREALQTVPLDVETLIQTHRELLDAFRAARIDSLQFWDILKTAYEMVLLKNKLPREARIDIVELLPALAWLWPNATVVKKTGLFPRYLLAYQLQKLRADKLLQYHGARLELGTATGGSTRNKNHVLYIPMGAAEGQYYLSLCFSSGIA